MFYIARKIIPVVLDIIFILIVVAIIAMWLGGK